MSRDAPTNIISEASGDLEFTELFSRPGFLVRRLHQIHVGIFMEECAAHDITPLQYGLLTVLRDGVAFDQITLATEVGVDRTTGSDVMRRLERRGLLERIPSPADRRAKQVRITGAGKQLEQDMKSTMAIAQARFVAPLEPEERTLFVTLMQKMIRANNDASRAPLRAARLWEQNNREQDK